MTGTISAGPAMMNPEGSPDPRTAATATSTYDGVAIIGGSNGQNDLGTAEIFSQWTNAFRVVTGATPRSGHFAVMLPHNGGILAMGGTGGQAVDLLQPWANSTAGAFVPAAASLNSLTGGFAAPATLGSLLAAGGQGSSANATARYWFPTIATDQPDYAPGTPVVMTGTGFQPGETANLYMREWVNQSVTDLPDYTATADANGNFTFNGYAPNTTDVGARYHLTAVGVSSGFQAQTIFTDSTNTDTTISSSENPSNSGDSVTFTATVVVHSTATAVTQGTVNFLTGNNCNGTAFATGVTLNGSGKATASTTFTYPSSSVKVFACYSGTAPSSGGYGSSFNSLTQNINASASTSTAATSPSVSYGQTATSTVTVTSTSSPTGSVAMTVSGGGSASCTALAAATSTTSTSTCTISYPNGVASSPYTLTATYTPTGSFTGSSGGGTLTVNQANLVISASSPTITYGDVVPAITVASYATFVNGDTAASLTTAPTCSVTGWATGTYPTAGTDATTCTGAVDPNYNISYVPGTLTVNPAQLTATLYPNDKTYDGTTTEPDANMHCTLMGVLPADSANVSCAASSGSFSSKNVGTWTVSATVSISGPAAGNYTLGAAGTSLSSTSASASASITPALVTATAGSYTGTYNGVAHSPSSCQVTGIYVGPLTCSNNPSSVGPDVSSGTVTPTVNYGSDLPGNYTVTPVNGSYSITPAVVRAVAGSYSGVFDNSTHSPSPCRIVPPNALGYIGHLTCTDNPSSVGPGVGSGSVAPVVNYGGDPTGDYSVTLVNGSWSITQAPTYVTNVMVTPGTQQYSDLVTLSATVTSTPTASGRLTFYINYNTATQQQLGYADLTTPATPSIPNVALLETVANSMSMGNHTVTAIFVPTDSTDFAGSDASTSLTITQEDAKSTYTGPTAYNTACPTCTSTTVPLSATIQDITAIDPTLDPNPGNILNAHVIFYDTMSNTTLCTATLSLVNPLDSKTATATCSFTASITGSNVSTTYAISVLVGSLPGTPPTPVGYYVCGNTDDTPCDIGESLTVSEPSATSFVTGGGYLKLFNSAGQVPGTVGSHNNFGFGIHYNKGGTALQGNFNTVFRSTAVPANDTCATGPDGTHVYQIQSAALNAKGSSLSVSLNSKGAGGSATLIAKGILTDVTNPLAQCLIDTGGALQVGMTDSSLPSSQLPADTISISLTPSAGGTVWYISNWIGSKVALQAIAGGNIAVH